MNRSCLPVALLLALLLALLVAPIASAQSLPKIKGTVTDYTGKLSNDDQAAINSAIETVVSNSRGRIHGVYVLFNPDMQGNDLSSSDRWGNQIFTSNGLGGTDILLTVAFGPNGLIVTSGGNLDGYFSRTGNDGSKTQRTYIGNTVKGDLKAKNYRAAMVTAVNLIGQIVPASSASQSSGQVPVAPAAPVQQSAPVASAPVQQSGGSNLGLVFCLVIGILLASLLIFLWWRRQNGYVDLGDDTTVTYGGRRRRGTYRPGGWRDGTYIDNSTVIVTDSGSGRHHHDSPASSWPTSTPAPSSDTTSFDSDDSDSGRSSTTSFSMPDTSPPASDPAPSSDTTGF